MKEQKPMPPVFDREMIIRTGAKAKKIIIVIVVVLVISKIAGVW